MPLAKVIPERVIEQQILMYLRSQGIFCWKNITGGFFDGKRFRKQASPYAINGTSDVLLCLPDGKFCSIEVKSKYGKLSPDQERFIYMIRKNGGIAFVAKCLEDVLENLKDYL